MRDFELFSIWLQTLRAKKGLMYIVAVFAV